MADLANSVRKPAVLVPVLGTLAALISLSSGCTRDASPEVAGISVQPPQLALLTDDRIEDKHPEFDPARVDSRPYADWKINASGAVLELDIETWPTNSPRWRRRGRPAARSCASWPIAKRPATASWRR